MPIGIQTFSDLIEGSYLYIDKTKDIYKFFAEGGKYYFLSRPRRFGKSLLVSVLGEIFSGNKELFKDLWIYDKIDWRAYPVIHLDFTGFTYGNEKELKETLNFLLDENAAKLDLVLKEKHYDKRFKELITTTCKKHNNKIVILIDEYDKPIIDYLDRQEIALANRNILRTFYSTIKAADRFVKFAFITGVSKFSKVSVFSGLNNLRDITLSDDFATLLGYTGEELEHYFRERIESTLNNGIVQSTSKEELLKNIKHWYNGYSWDGSHFVYNPHSILSFFKEKSFDNYWFSTATPTFLVKTIRERGVNVKEFEFSEVDNSVFESYDIEDMEISSLLFQTGYLSIKKRVFGKEEEKLYCLGYPNKEVRESFLKYLLKGFTEKGFTESFKILKKLRAAIYREDIPEFFTVLRSVFASLAYNMAVSDREGYYQTVIYLLLKLSGAHIQPEVETNIGRIDAVLETEKTVFILEFKVGSEQEALKQIKEKKYYEPYLSTGKKILLIGVGFDTGARNIGKYVTETLL